MAKVSVCVTSYGRIQSLDQCILTFLNLNTYPIERFIVLEDNPAVDLVLLKNKYPDVDFLKNESRIGQIKSIDKIYNMIDTEYIFHIEDDYIFGGNKNFILDSIEILSRRPEIHQIWCRHSHDHMAENEGSYKTLFENNILSIGNNIKYRMVSVPNTGNWCGFSFNPGLRRKSDYNKFFPNGYAEHMDNENEPGVITEYKCNLIAMKNNYRAAHLFNGCCYNTGYNTSTY
jgi:glycosyltransferase involved in cell wall biosynthesis